MCVCVCVWVCVFVCVCVCWNVGEYDVILLVTEFLVHSTKHYGTANITIIIYAKIFRLTGKQNLILLFYVYKY